MKRIVRKFNEPLPANSVYVGPGSKYQNPFNVNFEMDLDECLWRYRQFLKDGVINHTIDLKPLYGKDLACWCKLNTACHGDIILEFFEVD